MQQNRTDVSHVKESRNEDDAIENAEKKDRMSNDYFSMKRNEQNFQKVGTQNKTSTIPPRSRCRKCIMLMLGDELK